MIRISFPEKKIISFEQYDLLLGIVTGQKKLLSGKSTNGAGKNAKEIGVLGIIMVISGIILQFVKSENGALFHSILTYGAFSIGVLAILTALILQQRFKTEYKKTQEIAMNGEITFDQFGIRLDKDEEDGFDVSWVNFSHCFISKTLIVFLFKHEKQVVCLPFSEEVEKQVIEGLKEGQKEDLITYINVRSGKIFVE